MEGYIKPVTKQCHKKILDQMNNSIYKIKENEGKFGFTFLLYKIGKK